MSTSTTKVWSIETDYAEFEERVRKAAWKVTRGYQDYEDTVQDMLLAIAEAQATEPGFAEQTAAYQVTRAYWKAADWRRHLTDREAKHVRLDQPAQAAESDSAPLADLLMEEFVVDICQTASEATELSMDREGVREALAELARSGETGRKRAEMLYRRFYLAQSVAEASEAMGISKGTGCYYSAQGIKDLQVALAA